MKRLRMMLCLPLLSLPLSAAGTLTAHAAAVDAGTVECTASGSLSTNTGPVPQVVSFSAVLSLNCLGVGDDAGAWSFTMSGQMNPGFCAGGQGLANANFTGPDGSGTAGLQLASSATTLHMAGVLGSSDPGGDDFEATLSMTPTSGIPCVNTVTSENLSGHASITDQAPPPDEVFCTTSGGEGYNPAEMLAVQSVTIAGQASLSCTNPVSDDQGQWTINYNGVATADCGLAEGTLGMNFTAPDASGSGSIDYERVGTMLSMVGNSADNTFAIWAQVSFSGTCVSTPFFGANYTGAAAVVE